MKNQKIKTNFTRTSLCYCTAQERKSSLCLCKKETALQIVLRQPMLHSGKKDTEYADIRRRIRTNSELRNFSRRYQKCINVLLDMDKFKNKGIDEGSYLGQIRDIVNHQDSDGNTALHYACFGNYPAIAEDLVEFGGLVNIENKYHETPLEKCQGNLAKRLHGNISV